MKLGHAVRRVFGATATPPAQPYPDLDRALEVSRKGRERDSASFCAAAEGFLARVNRQNTNGKHIKAR